MKNTQVTLARRPRGKPVAEDFGVIVTETAQLEPGQALVKNLYISMDAGFRNWMDADSGDAVLPAMPIGKAVMGLILGRIIESRNPAIPEGAIIMARLAWEEYSVVDETDWLVTIEDEHAHPLSYHLGILGDTGMSAYFGMTDIGKPGPGETVLVSAAGGAVGSVAGQIARLRGARVLGLAGSEEKCRRLERELGYELVFNYKDAALSEHLGAACRRASMSTSITWAGRSWKLSWSILRRAHVFRSAGRSPTMPAKARRAARAICSNSSSNRQPCRDS